MWFGILDNLPYENILDLGGARKRIARRSHA